MTDSNKEDLRKKSKNNAYARFFASRRYKKLNSLSLFTLSISSFSLIFITLIDKYSCPNLFVENTLDLIQLISSIIISTLSLAISLSNYSEKALRMLKSGEDFNEIVRKLESINNDEEYNRKKDELHEKYNNLIKNSENHQDFEFYFGKLERKREESSSTVVAGKEERNIIMWLYSNATPWSLRIISAFYIMFIAIALIMYISKNGFLN
ncbi:SLATT domain-containing protein [Shewanella xiamenensis]|uniref:SLATT domain-containing protein n=1 Tax=Shewanella xiamenensis TaxID=332186 RepID=UPI0035BB2784